MDEVVFSVYESTDEHYLSLEYDKVHLQVSLSPLSSFISFLIPPLLPFFLNLDVGAENTC